MANEMIQKAALVRPIKVIKKKDIFKISPIESKECPLIKSVSQNSFQQAISNVTKSIEQKRQEALENFKNLFVN